MGVLAEKGSEVFQVSQPARHAGTAPHDLANRLLHWFDHVFHDAKANRCRN
jgi:hypothetical protein